MQVVGAFVRLGHWLPLMVDTVAAPQAALPTRVNALVVLSAMLHAAGMPLHLFCTSHTMHTTVAELSKCHQYVHAYRFDCILLSLCAYVITVSETACWSSIHKHATMGTMFSIMSQYEYHPPSTACV